MFILTILGNSKETRLAFSPGSVTVLQIMDYCQEAKVKIKKNTIKQIKICSKKWESNNIKNK